MFDTGNFTMAPVPNAPHPTYTLLNKSLNKKIVLIGDMQYHMDNIDQDIPHSEALASLWNYFYQEGLPE